MTKAENVYLTHENEIAWILALRQMIHGGDPVPDKIHANGAEALAAATLSAVLPGNGALTFEQLKKGLGALQIEVSRGSAPEVELETTGGPRRVKRPPLCFTFNGRTTCVYLPDVIYPAGE